MHRRGRADDRRRRVVICSWRDEAHPEAGGSERYVGEVARYLAAAGDDVVVLCADHGRAPRDETRDGVRWRRRGGHLSVFPLAAAQLPRLRPDVVIDVQNGVPFAARLFTRAPVVVLVHHVHREQWPVALKPLAARAGWWVESALAPRLLHGCRYVAVSSATARELESLGVDGQAVTVVRNGREEPVASAAPAARPTVCVVGRLVPHKRVEHAIDAVAQLRSEGLDVTLDIVGDGHWRPHLWARIERLGLSCQVTLHGYLSRPEKHRLMARSWVHVCPSLKEGWGLVVIEAASHGVPTIAYRDAGGVTESVLDGVTGVLATGPQDLVDQLRRLIRDPATRCAMGQAARAYAEGFSWSETGEEFDKVLADVAPRAGSSRPFGVSARRR